MQVRLLIDAEESWMQDAADDLIEHLMKKFNTERPYIYSTLQMYRWDRLDYLKDQHRKAKEGGYYLGYKLVRGAYMEKENARAEEMGYPTPICASKEETDTNFDNAVHYIMDNLKVISLFAGTHNEASTYLILECMKERELLNNDENIWFGQLYGMSDHISYNLSASGYNVAKYLPFGPVRDVMPYLIRRAEENTSVVGQTNRELALLNENESEEKSKSSATLVYIHKLAESVVPNFHIRNRPTTVFTKSFTTCGISIRTCLASIIVSRLQ